MTEIEKLYELCHEIPNSYKMKSKYTFLIKERILKGRLLTINDSLEKDTKINRFINSYNTVLIFPNYINKVLVDLQVKPLDSNERFLQLGNIKPPYGIGRLDKDFKYGDPLFLVEGIADFGALKIMNPRLNVVAIRSNALAKSYYPLLTSLTNNIVMIPDNDEAGLSQINTIKKNFNKLNTGFNIVIQYEGLKDTGDFIDLLMNYKKSPTQDELDLIKDISNYYIQQFKHYL